MDRDNRQYIRDYAWAELENKYPDAAAYMRQEALKGELAYLDYRLKAKFTLNDWQLDRLEELKMIAESWM